MKRQRQVVAAAVVAECARRVNLPMRLALTLIVFIASQLAAFAEPGRAIKVDTKQISSFSKLSQKTHKFGELEFLGGLVLSSKDKDFGGFSGIRHLSKNRLFAISDQGEWLSFEVDYNANRLSGILGARMGRLRDAKGKKLKRKKDADAEGLEVDGNDFLISFERNHRAERFTFNAKGQLKAQKNGQIYELSQVGLSKNKGPEGIALAPKKSPVAGTYLAFPELSFNAENNLRVFMFNGDTRKEFAIVPAGGFSLTDADFSPNGDLYVLERSYFPIIGNGMRIRKFSAETIQPNAVLKGETLITANDDFEIDNMEGIGVSPTGDGTLITLISDNNFSKSQRTLVLEFLLRDK